MSDTKLILYIAMSADGFVAGNDDDLSWLSVAEKEGEDYGYGDFISTVGSYFVGRKTYEKVLELTGGTFPHADQFPCYVITRQEKADENGVSFYNGPIEDLVQKLKAQGGGNIYCDGGAEIVRMLMEKDLIDEYIISVIPIFLGDGKRLFKGGINTLNLKTKPAKYYDTGAVQLHYIRH